MRLKFSSVVMSLAVASSIYAVPAHVAHPQKRDWVSDKLGPLFTQVLKDLDCGSCVAALVGMKDVAAIDKNLVLNAVNDLCPELSKESPDVCKGLVFSQGPVLLDSLLSADLTGGDGDEICFQAVGLCPAPAIASGTLTFPKPRPLNPVIPPPSGTQVDVLHLSDWHVDEQYAAGTEALCGKPTCCRNFSDSPVKPQRAASSWGDYNCDTPLKLGQSLLSYVPTVANPSFAIMTGDIPAHDIWLENQTTVVPEEFNAFTTLASLGTDMYPTVGNHEAGPPNLFPTEASGGNISFMYDGLASDWSRWLSADAVDSVKNYGAYNFSPRPGFRIISLNTNFCYNLNFYLYAHVKDYDPNGEIQWLITQLQAAEDACERVWIIGHVAPSQTDCIQNWAALYYQVVQRYSPHVIAEQFFGHSHMDDFSLFYNSTTKNPQTVVSTSWIGPSVTPFTNLNPGFRVYKVDTGNWNVYDSFTYVADLSQASTWDATGSSPNWHLEYSARQAYGAYVPITADQPLGPSWWHQVTTAFESNATAFQEYYTFRGKSANLLPACSAGSACSTELICDLRAGKSSDSCSQIMFAAKREDDGGAGAKSLHSDFRRGLAKPWNTKLCGAIYR